MDQDPGVGSTGDHPFPKDLGSGLPTEENVIRPSRDGRDEVRDGRHPDV